MSSLAGNPSYNSKNAPTIEYSPRGSFSTLERRHGAAVEKGADAGMELEGMELEGADEGALEEDPDPDMALDRIETETKHGE
jgi:hypothetical protein